VHPRRWRAIILGERNRRVDSGEAYDVDKSILRFGRHASSPSGKAVETRTVAVPQCTVVSGQIDLNTGGEGATPMRKLNT